MVTGGQPVTLNEAWTTVLKELPEKEQSTFQAFKDAFEDSVPSPSNPEMAAVWTPMNAALYKTIHQDMPPKDAAAEAQRRIDKALGHAR
jgi:maltose-binding protein MalE